jgi:membrane protein YdbS with pleckstrin-like domain
MEISNIFLFGLLHAVVFAVICYFIGAHREIGALAGGFLGLLGIIGLIIVLCSRRKEPLRFTDQLQKYKALFDSGTITETEYNNLKGRLFEQQ